MKNQHVIRRTPIKLDKNAVALMTIYTAFDKLEDHTFKEEFGEWMDLETYATAAKQFVSQLEDRWCVAFMEALRDEIDNQIKEHKKKYKMK